MRRKHPIREQGKSRPRRTATLSRFALFFLLIATLFGVLLILRPFIAPIVLALLLVSIFHPVFRRIRRALGNRDNLAAIATVAVVFIAVVIPFVLFLTALVQQGMDFSKQAQHWLAQGNLEKLAESERVERWLQAPLIVNARELFQRYFPAPPEQQTAIPERLLDLSRQTLQFLGERLIPVLTKTGMIVINFVIMLLVMFYAFRDGNRMLDYVLQLMPMAASQQRLVLDRIRYIARAVLLGTLLTASTQAGLGMIAFHIVGIPALFWGVMIGIASLVPFIGTALVWVPATIYLFAAGHNWQAVFMSLWGMIVISFADNFLRPFFMKGQSGMSVLVLFFAILGGIRLFGPMGIIYGPLIFGLCAVFLYIYKLENQHILTRLGRE